MMIMKNNMYISCIHSCSHKEYANTQPETVQETNDLQFTDYYHD